MKTTKWLLLFEICVAFLSFSGCSDGTSAVLDGSVDVGEVDLGMDADSLDQSDEERFVLLEGEVRPDSCDSIDGIDFDIDGTDICVFQFFPGTIRTCPETNPYRLEVGDHLVCASGNTVEVFQVYEVLDERCGSSLSQDECEQQVECEFVEESLHYFYGAGGCEATERGICVFVPQEVGQLDLCLTRETTKDGVVEVVMVDGKDSPTWKQHLDEPHSACDCLD